jgi:hypothetical protein
VVGQQPERAALQQEPEVAHSTEGGQQLTVKSGILLLSTDNFLEKKARG